MPPNTPKSFLSKFFKPKNQTHDRHNNGHTSSHSTHTSPTYSSYSGTPSSRTSYRASSRSRNGGRGERERKKTEYKFRSNIAGLRGLYERREGVSDCINAGNLAKVPKAKFSWEEGRWGAPVDGRGGGQGRGKVE
ncbi:hypothetical protein P280DRAFT_505198 [Massarina eburnea CBS 473.64]|uniref:Uncharacterized protein n=1 Tax=Massarina eburnea CBS 473.64 TaxID=1395130 RepID=A0A6A6S9R8_9PLEO|nr:hypothetical protein P280DRAFT_505198 [Massarina eburnea CBS 473.64]